jgi:hypothetical protein
LQGQPIRVWSLNAPTFDIRSLARLPTLGICGQPSLHSMIVDVPLNSIL